MELFKQGTFAGTYKRNMELPGLIMNEAEYIHDYVDWHYHENAYFTYILHGHVLEVNKKQSYHCTPGTLLFHHWQDPHYNEKYPVYTQGFHLEIQKNWFSQNGLTDAEAQGSIHITCPIAKSSFNRIYCEFRISDELSELSINTLLIALYSQLPAMGRKKDAKEPKWVSIVRQILRDQFTEKITLKYLSDQANVHPVHLSTSFSRYFNATIGEYIRHLRVERSISLLADDKSVAETAYDCGFADQSHFIKSFRKLNGVTPLHFKKIIKRQEP